jgi:formiminotetrahydrofolate cyclodeaminase
MDDRLTDLTVTGLVDRLATSDPIPGGGSAAAVAGAMAAALVRMVVALTTGRPIAADHERELADVEAAAAAAQADLLRLAQEDAAAYDAVVRARRLPRATDAERERRQAQVVHATREATRVPLRTAVAAATALELAERLAPFGNRNAVSDVAVGALLAATAIRGAALNVRINVPHLPEDDALRTEAEGVLEPLLGTLDARERAVRDLVEERMR